MKKIRITREFKFEMAHALFNYDGPCRNIHGHSYLLYVSVIGKPIDDSLSPHNGMVLDFSLLKKIISEEIVDNLDHSLILSDMWPKPTQAAFQGFCKVFFVPYQPTCENLLLDIVTRIDNLLPSGVELHHVKLCETATSYAEWYAEDNQ